MCHRGVNKHEKYWPKKFALPEQTFSEVATVCINWNNFLFPQASLKLLFQELIVSPSPIMLTKMKDLGWHWSRMALSLWRPLTIMTKSLYMLTMQQTLHVWSLNEGTRCLCACLPDARFLHLALLPPLLVFWSGVFKNWHQADVTKAWDQCGIFHLKIKSHWIMWH